MGAKEHPGVISLAIDDLFAAVEPLPADAVRLKVGPPAICCFRVLKKPGCPACLQPLQQLPILCQLQTCNAVPAFQVDMLELYNEELRDLLAPALDKRRKQSLQIQVSCSPAPQLIHGHCAQLGRCCAVT